MKHINIYTDGGSRGNPGPAASGAFIESLDKGYERYLGETTNNVAEYDAVGVGLSKLKHLIGKDKTKQTSVEVFMDSQLAVKQLSREYKIQSENIIPLFIKIHNLCVEYGKVTFTYIPREKNKKADSLVNKCLDENTGAGGLF